MQCEIIFCVTDEHGMEHRMNASILMKCSTFNNKNASMSNKRKMLCEKILVCKMSVKHQHKGCAQLKNNVIRNRMKSLQVLPLLSCFTQGPTAHF